MKECLLLFARCQLLLLVLCGGLPVMGQVYANVSAISPQAKNLAAQAQDEDKRSVRSILFALEGSYRVSFNYNDAVVRAIHLKEDFLWSKEEKLEEVLDRLTKQAGLKYEKAADNNYLVVPQKKEATEKSKAQATLLSAPEDTSTRTYSMEQNPQREESAIPEHIVSGIVTDESSTPMPGVNVVVKGTTNGTTTDSNGKYTLSLPEGSGVLVFSFIGYKTIEVGVDNQTSINITLAPDVQTLEQIVVVGYGEQERGKLLGAVAEVKAQDIQDFPVANLATSLVNRVPGVAISQASGKPGATTLIRIRKPDVLGGVNSTEDPLYVIDGFQVTRQDFDNLDATQVESVTFLKDASAAIYGSRGGNGVVLVKTKRGQQGKAKISYSGSYALSEATRFPSMLNGYDHVSLLNDFYATKGADVPETSLYTEDELNYLRTNNHRWLDEVWQDSHLTRHTLNISGGNDQVTYFAGGSFYDETGNLRDLYITKYNMRFGMNANITDRLTASISLSTDNSTQNRPSPKGVTVQSETLSETISSLILMPGWVPMYHDGKPVYSSVPGWHPYELQNTGTYARSKSQGMILNTSLEYKVPKIEGLSVRLQYAKNQRTGFGKEYYVSYKLYDFVREGAHAGSGTYGNQNVMFTNTVNAIQNIKNGNFLAESHSSSSSYQLNESITYARKFGKHDLSILAVAEQIESSGDDFNTQREGQVIPEMDQLFAFSGDKSLWDNMGTSNESGRMSYLGRLTYNFNDRYLVEATYRADASPHFAKDSQWGYFPAVAAGWRISDEGFFQNSINFIDDLKIRGQIGLIGRDAVTNYQYKERYTQTTGMLFGNTLTNGLNNNVSPNPSITWEKVLYKGIGVDGTFWNSRFNFAIDYYTRNTYDMFQSPTATVPTTFGGTIASQNYAEVKSWGWEAALGYSGNAGGINYFVGVNVNITDNKVIQSFVSEGDKGTWRDPNGRRSDSGIEGYKSLGIVRTQEQLDAFLAEHPGYEIDGDAPELGWVLFEDQNDDGVITEDDKVRLYSRSGNRVGLGYNLGASWKGFKFSANIAHGIGGLDVYDKPARTVPNANQTALTHWKDAWSVNNIDGAYPVIDANYSNEIYDLWIIKATTMRVNNMSLSYSLPGNLALKWRIPQLRIFVTGTNLWDIINNHPYKYSTGNLSTDYPALRTYTLGVNLTL